MNNLELDARLGRQELRFAERSTAVNADSLPGRNLYSQPPHAVWLVFSCHTVSISLAIRQCGKGNLLVRREKPSPIRFLAHPGKPAGKSICRWWILVEI
ncbi:hypothetical protein [uncultured Oscillibacter sp.]|uniref:hypothetical protein n=1 Tax=uncultured Oscillibacter sp. TaxID=876091 RepID=UPI002622F8EF|nr:hypothetical protein [uncultured Oscillibacter sp.]